MATIIVEDGTSVANANSYLSEADLNVYAGSRGIILSGVSSELLIQAMDYIEQQDFKGDKASEAQPLLWPRDNVWLDGYYLDTGTIPQLLKDAVAEAAIAVDNGTGPLSAVPRQTKREKLGELEVEYMDGAISQTYNKKLETKLRKLLRFGARLRTERV